MRHPETGGEFLTARSAVGTWVAAGWAVAEEGIDPDVPTPLDPAPTGSVRMGHKELDTEITVAAAAVAQYEAAGWKAVKGDPGPVQPPPPPADPESPVTADTSDEPQPRARREKERP